MAEDHDFTVAVQDEASVGTLSALAENPNQPKGIHRFQTSSPGPMAPSVMASKPTRKMSTKQFGELWLAYTEEQSVERGAQHEALWTHLVVVDTIGQETIATAENGNILVHADAKTFTVRATSASVLARFIAQYL